MTGSRFQVTVAMVVAKTPGGRYPQAYFQRGAFLPDEVPPAERVRLVGLGLVEEIKPPRGKPAPAGE